MSFRYAICFERMRYFTSLRSWWYFSQREGLSFWRALFLSDCFFLIACRASPSIQGGVTNFLSLRIGINISICLEKAVFQATQFPSMSSLSGQITLDKGFSDRADLKPSKSASWKKYTWLGCLVCELQNANQKWRPDDQRAQRHLRSKWRLY